MNSMLGICVPCCNVWFLSGEPNYNKRKENAVYEWISHWMNEWMYKSVLLCPGTRPQGGGSEAENLLVIK